MKSTSVLPLLPPEVWICIFHHAVHVPGTLVPDIYAHAGLIGPAYNSIFQPRLREARITKCALVRVCKQWWQLTILFLYQSVYISQVRCLTLLSKTLADYAAGEGTVVGAQLLGEYTQRLDIVIRDRYVCERADMLAALISCMPNLAIVSFATATSYTANAGLPNRVVDVLNYMAPSLRVLDWSPGLLEPSTSQLIGLLPKCTHLRILNCPRLVWSKDLVHGGFPPTITTLHVETIIHGHDFVHLSPVDTKGVCRPGPSALQELIISLDRDLSRWTDLLRVYGPQLVSIQFHIPGFSFIDVKGWMELLARTCPSLRRLTITSERFSTFIRQNLVFPSISYLGLRATQLQLQKREINILSTFLEELRSSVPSLQVVRLLDERNLRCLFNTHTKLTVEVLRQFIEAVPFRVEDKEGVSLTVRLIAFGRT